MIRCKSKEIHQKQITQLQEEIRNCKKKVALRPSCNPSNTLRNSAFKNHLDTLDLSKLDQILEIDYQKKLITVEPKITIRKLTKLLLQEKLMLAVVPEFGSITVGGAIMGTSLESSSHRYGQFNDLCTEYELILGDGRVVIANTKEKIDLFYGVVGSYGSLALLTAITLKVIEAKKYVHLHYKRFWNTHDLVHHLSLPTHYDFLEGVLLTKSWGVAIEGSLTNQRSPLPFNSQDNFYKPWFYQHLMQVTKEGSFEEIMPIEDYLFRFDRGAFWMGKFIGNFKFIAKIIFRFRVQQLPNMIKKRRKSFSKERGPSLWFRALFAPFLSSKKLYSTWHKVPNTISASLFFIQDFYTPISQTHLLLETCINTTQIYPIWLCPIKNTTQGQFLSPHYHEERMINIGLYGLPQVDIPIPLITKKLEKEIYKSGGKKMLYSYTYYDEDLFSKIYDLKSYNKLREKYRATDVFCHIYDKVKSLH